MPAPLGRAGASASAGGHVEEPPSALAIGDLLQASVQDRVSEPQLVAISDPVEPEVIVEASVAPVIEPEPVAPALEAFESVVDASEVERLEGIPPVIELGGEIEASDASPLTGDPGAILDLGSMEQGLAAPERAFHEVESPVVEPASSLEAPSNPPIAEDGPIAFQAGDAISGSESAEPLGAPYAAAPAWAPLPEEDDDPTPDEESDLAPMSELSAPLDLSPFDHETGERLSVVIESAPEAFEALVVETDAQAAALEVLEQVTRRVRSGELRVAPSGASAESVLASILAALLSPRS